MNPLRNQKEGTYRGGGGDHTCDHDLSRSRRVKLRRKRDQKKTANSQLYKLHLFHDLLVRGFARKKVKRGQGEGKSV